MIIDVQTGRDRGLVVQGLSAVYSTGEGVREASFDLWPAQVAVIVGKNGAGKTTLLKALSTLLPHNGTIRLGGRGVMDQRSYRKEIAFMPDDPALPPWLNATEISHWVAALWDDKGYRDRFGRIASSFFPASETLLRPVQTFSRGMQQRLAICLTMARNARLYLLDEPDAYLDVLSRSELERDIKSVAEAGAMVLLSTHDPDAAARLAQRLFILRHGRLAEAPSTGGQQTIVELLREDD